MQEITWPSSLVVPVRFDYSNPIVNTLVTTGSLVYYSDDNLATVTCINNNTLATSADLTNSSLVSPLGDYSVGIDTTSLSPEQITAISSDPYQIFETQEEHVTGNVLKLNGSNQYVLFSSKIGNDTASAGDDTEDWTSRFVFTTTNSSSSYVYRFASSSTISRCEVLIRKSDGLVRFVSPISGQYQWSIGAISEDYLDISFIKPSGVRSLELIINGVSYGLDAGGDNASCFDIFGMKSNGGWFDGYLHLIEFVDRKTPSNTVLFSFDQPTGTTTVPDLQGSSNEASLVNSPIFEPIIEKQVFTVGTGKDYTDIRAWGFDQYNKDYHPVAQCFGEILVTSDFDWRNSTDFVHKFTIEGANQFDGNINNPDVAVIKHDPSYTGHIFDDRTGRGTYRNLILDAQGMTTFAGFGSAIITFERVALLNRSPSTIENNTFVMDKCLVHSTGRPLELNRPFYATDTIFVGSSDDDRGLIRTRSQSSEFYNSIFIQNGTGDIFDAEFTTTGSNNFANKAITSIGTENSDAGTWLDSNYQINQTGQTALTGTGWNGSNIVEWAWSGESPPAPDNTLEIDSGAFNLTGLSVGTLKSSKLTLEQGSTSFDGEEVILKKSYRITTDLGQATFSGESNRLLKSYRTTPTQGNILTFGEEVTLSKSYRIAPETGEITFEGTDIPIKKGLRINLSSGNLEFNGSPIELVHSGDGQSFIGITAGLVEVQGSEVTLKQSRIMSVGTGNINFSGNSLSMYKGVYAPIGTGSISAVGSPINMIKNSVVTLSGGQVLFDGYPINFRYSNAVIVRVSGYKVSFEPSPIKVSFKKSLIRANYS